MSAPVGRDLAPPRVCFLPGKAPTWPEMAALAQLLAEAGWARPVMLLAGARGQAYLADCQGRRLDHISLEDAPSAPGPGLGRRAWHKFMLTVRGPAAGLEPLARGLERVLVHQERLLEQALAALKPAAVVTADERLFNWELPLIKCARRRGVPVVVLPISFVADRESLLPFRQSSLHQAASFKRLAAEHPQQVAMDQARQAQVFFYPAPMTLALARQGMLPPRPWVPGGGDADLLLAEGEKACQRFLAQGASPQKVMVTGQRAHDELFLSFQEGRALKEDEGSDAPRRLVLSLPQLAEQGIMTWDAHWREIRFLAQTLTGLPGQSLLSLHPKMDPSKYRFIEAEYGLAIAARPLVEVLPQAHVFAASFSSTVAWAMLCRLPTVVFDFYGLDFRMYDGLGGVTVIRERAQLQPALARLLGDRGHHARQQALLEPEAARLAPLDGQSGQRILAAIRRAAGL